MKFHSILLLLPFPMFNVIYSFIIGLYIISLSELLLVFTSILYWTNLNNIHLRILDIVIVQITIIIHFIYCYIYYCLYPILLMCSWCLLIYLIGKYYNSDIIHSFVWISGFISKFILLSNYKLYLHEITF